MMRSGAFLGFVCSLSCAAGCSHTAWDDHPHDVDVHGVESGEEADFNTGGNGFNAGGNGFSGLKFFNAVSMNPPAIAFLLANGLNDATLLDPTFNLQLIDPDAREFIKYLVWGLLDNDQSVTFADVNNHPAEFSTTTYAGSLGACKGATRGPISTKCQELASAFVASHTNIEAKVLISLRHNSAPFAPANWVPVLPSIPGEKTIIDAFNECASPTVGAAIDGFIAIVVFGV